MHLENEWNFMLIRAGDDKSLENPVAGGTCAGFIPHQARNRG